MTVTTNPSIGDENTSYITTVWFGKYNPESSDKSGIKMLDTLNSIFNEGIKYSIDWTDSATYPKMPGLMEYNRVTKIDVPNTYDRNSFNEENTHYIGEYFHSDEIATSKVVFPKVLADLGYNIAVVYQEEFMPTINSKYGIDSNNEYYYDDPDNTNALYWRYIIALDDEVTSIDRVTNNIIQFTNDSKDVEEIFTNVHVSNYSNPHTDQIARISTQSEMGNPISYNRFNDLITNVNSIAMGNQLVTEDYSVVYIGNYLYLDDKDIDWEND